MAGDLIRPLTQVHIIKMDVTKEDEGERFGAVVVFPNKNSEIHSLKEWYVITERADKERTDADKPYIDLQIKVIDWFYKFLVALVRFRQ